MADRIKALVARTRWKGPAAAALGFLEGSVVLVPVEPLLIPLMTTSHRRAIVIALYAALGNLAAALIMYGFGALLFEPLVQPALAYLQWTEEFESVRRELNENAFVALFLVGVTPVPFQAGTLAAGATGVSLAVFIAAVGLSRSLRYLVFALLVMALGARAHDFIARHERAILIGGVVVFVMLAALFMATR